MKEDEYNIVMMSSLGLTLMLAGVVFLAVGVLIAGLEGNIIWAFYAWSYALVFVISALGIMDTGVSRTIVEKSRLVSSDDSRTVAEIEDQLWGDQADNTKTMADKMTEASD